MIWMNQWLGSPITNKGNKNEEDHEEDHEDHHEEVRHEEVRVGSGYDEGHAREADRLLYEG